MITIGLIKELYFISMALKTPVVVEFSAPASELKVKVENRYFDVWYRGTHIWRELVDGPTSMFGLESCDNISRIIVCIENGTDWQKYKYIDTTPKA